MKRLATFLLAATAAVGPAEAARAPASFQVTLVRGACFGTCPVYRVTIDARGQVVYLGGRPGRGPATTCQGERRWRVPASRVARLRAMVDRIGFFGLADRYAGRVTDLPSYEVIVTEDGRTKSVIDYAGPMVGMPAGVRQLEAAIDAAADTARCLDPKRATP